MRVIAGEFRSRRLKSLPGLDVRPTPDRLRETLFSILGQRVEGCTFIDAYAGTGAVGIEALSRGASRVIFLERSRASIQVIRENLSTLGARERVEVVSGKASKLLARFRGDIVFLDPPYHLREEYESCLEELGNSPPALVIAQHDTRLTLKEAYGALRRSRIVKQGDNVLTFFLPVNAE